MGVQVDGSDDAGIVSYQLTGARGLSAMGSRGVFSSRDPNSFASGWREVAIDGVTVGEWQISPVSGSCLVGASESGVVLVVVTDGLFRCRVRTEVLDGSPDSVLILAASDTVRFEIPMATRMLRIEVPAQVFPQVVRPLSVESLGGTRRTRLTDSLASLVEVVLDPAVGGPHCPATRAIHALSAAVLEEAAAPVGATTERARIVEYIEAHLTEPDLDPQSIASAFGISLRWVHHLFSRDGESIARYIRHRRLDLVAARLRTDHRFPRIAALAERHGFPSRDQLTRAFKARYGVPIAEYAAFAAAGDAPEPLSDTSQDDEPDRSAL